MYINPQLFLIILKNPRICYNIFMKNYIKLNNNDSHLSLGNFFRLIKDETKNKRSAIQSELFSSLFSKDNINDTTINNYCVGYRTIGDDYKQIYLNYYKRYKDNTLILLEIILNITFIMEGNVSNLGLDEEKIKYINNSEAIKNLVTKLYNIMKNDKSVPNVTAKLLIDYKNNNNYVLFLSEIIFFIMLIKKQPIYEKDLKKEAIEKFLYNSEISVKELEEFLNIKFTEGISHHHSFKKLSSNNNPYAAYELGMEEYKGNVVGYPRYDRSYEYFKIAANYNHPAANHMLARLIINKQVNYEDNNKAYTYLSRAIEDGSIAAVNTLAIMYLNGIAPLKKDVKKAIKYFEEAASENYVYAYNNLGKIYEDDDNIEKAVYYYELGAKLEESWALNKLGEFYRKGIYYKEDTDLAYDYYIKSIDSEISNACYYGFYNLAKYYYLNKESKHYNKEKGIKHLEIAKNYKIIEASILLLYIYTEDYLNNKNSETLYNITLLVKSIENHKKFNNEYKKIIENNLYNIKNKISIDYIDIIN